MNALTEVARDHRESSDAYRGELRRLGRWRVALCRDGIQYLLQRQRPGKAGVGAAWDSVSYCVTLTALLRIWRRETGDAGQALMHLPERAPMLDQSARQNWEFQLRA